MSPVIYSNRRMIVTNWNIHNNNNTKNSNNNHDNSPATDDSFHDNNDDDDHDHCENQSTTSIAATTKKETTTKNKKKNERTKVSLFSVAIWCDNIISCIMDIQIPNKYFPNSFKHTKSASN
mmetsp:Transcript_2726/g.3143  ORF Transcript_2726/g.3143 Transcript_2726/m.3143 type:complete len:121 (-) Transcript_2726:356-718(-)